MRPTPVRSIYAVVRDAAAQTPPARVTLDALVAVAHAVRREREASTGAAAAPGAPAVPPRRLDGHRRRPSAVGSPTK
ncbi:hypothetical protein [Isoptericola variabilis]|uniref:hypothetical protein n=1 Tax=Isoptericola variabilis TaxID=139208 RepID=UPI0016422D82|nr:hypothetical protein [Isoptericola variabilis]